MMLQPRDEQILQTLTLRVRLLTARQIAATWWGVSSSSFLLARRRLIALQRGGLLQRHQILARPLLALEAPIFTWQPNQPDPDPAPIAYRLQSRWTRAPELVGIVHASAVAAKQFGGAGGRLAHPEQATHDLHVAALYLRALRDDPARAAGWWVEDLRGKAGYRLKDPDVVLFDDDAQPMLIIEFGGEYDAKRVREFHDHCRTAACAYELW